MFQFIQRHIMVLFVVTAALLVVNTVRAKVGEVKELSAVAAPRR